MGTQGSKCIRNIMLSLYGCGGEVSSGEAEQGVPIPSVSLQKNATESLSLLESRWDVYVWNAIPWVSSKQRSAGCKSYNAKQEPYLLLILMPHSSQCNSLPQCPYIHAGGRRKIPSSLGPMYFSQAMSKFGKCTSM